MAKYVLHSSLDEKLH